MATNDSAIADNGINQGDLVNTLGNIITDITAIRAGLLVVTAQLDADATVTDTDYAANADPAAITAKLTAG